MANRKRNGQRRDSQRSKVYAAERAAFDTDEDHDPLYIQECQEIVNRLWDHRSFDKYTVFSRPPEVYSGNGNTGCRRRIKLCRWGRRTWVVLHELAHAMLDTYDDAAAWHGPEFCALYLQLVEIELGFEARQRLGKELIARKAKTRP